MVFVYSKSFYGRWVKVIFNIRVKDLRFGFRGLLTVYGNDLGWSFRIKG